MARRNPDGELLDLSKSSEEMQLLENSLRSYVVGQDEAIKEVVDVYRVIKANLSVPGRPLANTLFLGPTGVGKTLIPEIMAKVLFGNRRALVKIDCAEYQHGHEISKIVGSPPGFVGFKDTQPLLSQKKVEEFRTEKDNFSIIVLDELEKANESLWSLFLGIMDKGILTLGDTSEVDFSKCWIIMTSNVGADEIQKNISGGIGFVKEEDNFQDKFLSIGLQAMRKKFSPEFLNRLDKVISFRTLSKQDLSDVLDIEIRQLQERVMETSCPFVLNYTASARKALLEDGYDPRYGARHLKRSIAKNIVTILSVLIDTKQVLVGDVIKIDYDGQFKALKLK